MEPVVLDTDVASLSLKGKLPPDVLRLLGGRCPLSPSSPSQNSLGGWSSVSGERTDVSDWLAGWSAGTFDDDVARTWGVITAYAYLRGRPRPTNDSWIAACCLAYDLPLATLNVKDFEDFAAHEGLRILGG